MISNHQPLAMARAYSDPTAAIVERFLPMVRKLAWHLHGLAGADIEPDDLVQTGLMALTECAQRHHGSDQDGFAAYAKIRVKGAMIDQLRRSAPISRGAIQRRREIRIAEDRLRLTLGREPTLTELAQAMNVEPRQLGEMRRSSEQLNFEPIDEVYSDSDMAFCDQSADAFALLVSNENRQALIGAITNLPERLQIVIQLYFAEELNLAEIAAVLGVTVPRVHQLKFQALQKMQLELVNLGVESAA